jgi:hypothetical protein
MVCPYIPQEPLAKNTRKREKKAKGAVIKENGGVLKRRQYEQKDREGYEQTGETWTRKPKEKEISNILYISK